MTVDLIQPGPWPHGEAAGVCDYGASDRPAVRVQRRDPGATAGTLLHEYAYAVLHNGALDKTEQAARRDTRPSRPQPRGGGRRHRGDGSGAP